MARAAPLWVFSDDRLGPPSLARASLDGQQVIAASENNNTLAVLDRNGGKRGVCSLHMFSG